MSVLEILFFVLYSCTRTVSVLGLVFVFPVHFYGSSGFRP